ncbi:MAG: hydroxymethylbilane synthase [Thermoplasmataceae archaeon]
MTHIKIGTRPSHLAVRQAEMVAERLAESGIDSSIHRFNSWGDTEQTVPLFRSSGTGIFVEEINRRVLSGEVDIAVHSAKDLPADLPEELEAVSILPRESINDVLVSEKPLEDLSPGSHIGTSSLRRIKELLMVRPDLVAENVRGNIETRIQKYRDGKYDGIILAEAGISRLGIDVTYHRLGTETFMPAANQGIIAVVGIRGSDALSTVKRLENRDAQFAMEIEREAMRKLKLGCSMPAGMMCTRSGTSWTLRVRLYSLNTREYRDYASTVKNQQDADEFASRIVTRIPPEFGYGRDDPA